MMRIFVTKLCLMWMLLLGACSEHADIEFGYNGEEPYPVMNYLPAPERDAGPGWTSNPREPTSQTPECFFGLTKCGDRCVNLMADATQCGVCGVACARGESCKAGVCTSPCVLGEVLCDGVCRNLTNDPDHCGSCTTPCPGSSTCVLGQCACPKDTTSCGASCVDTAFDDRHCGKCDNACASDSQCREGACVPLTSDWPTDAGGMLRSGYNARERGVPPLEKGWEFKLGSDPLYPAAVAGSRVLIAADGLRSGMRPLVALDLTTGSEKWRRDFGNAWELSQVTMASGRIYLSSAGSRSHVFWSLADDDGHEIWHLDSPYGWDTYGAPTLTSQGVYAGADYGLLGLERLSGRVLFRNMDQGSIDPWTAAARSDRVFTFIGNTLRAHDERSGTTRDSMLIKAQNGRPSSPVLSPEGVIYLVVPPMLYAVDLTTKQTLWSAADNFASVPALAEGLLLALNSEYLVAFDAQTGASKWRCKKALNLIYPPIAANGFAYVSSETTTFAVDLRDGNVVWQAEVGGRLSIAGGRLFVAGKDGTLRSYTLTSSAVPSADPP